MNYTEIEAKVREATNDEHWGPTGQQMNEIASHTFSYESFPEVMGMLWKRMLQDNRTNWRRTYKSLILLHYLVRNGSERVVTSSREHIYDLKTLENYAFHDEMGKDMGINVRHRAKQLIDFIQDDDRLREERKKAKKNKDKYIGVSADAMSGGFGSFGRSGGSNKSGTGSGYSDSWSDAPKTIEFDDEEEKRSKSTFEDLSPVSDESRSSPLQRTTSPTSPPSIGAVKPIPVANKTSTPAATKPRVPIAKKIDLGAAAHYKGDGQSKQATIPPPPATTTNSSVLLADLFASEPVTTTTKNELADLSFSSASEAVFPSQNLVTSNEENFADFESAFSAGITAPSMTASSSIYLLSENLLETSVFSGPTSIPAMSPSNMASLFATPATTPLGAINPLVPPAIGSSPIPPQSVSADLLDDAFSSMPTSLTQQIAQTTLQPLRPTSFLNNNSSSSLEVNKPCSGIPSNTTWSNLAQKVNIDVDNLLGNKNDNKSSPSMNQLAAGITAGSSRVAPSNSSVSPVSGSTISWTNHSSPTKESNVLARR